MRRLTYDNKMVFPSEDLSRSDQDLDLVTKGCHCTIPFK